MASPFPGMDPFLEDPDEFGDFHDSFIVHLRDKLQTVLSPPYFAKTGQRVWVEISERPIEPDVSVFRPRKAGHKTQSGVATATLKRKPIVIKVMHDEEREPFVEIYRKQGTDVRLVASIEVLSPSNKTPGQAAQTLYLKKQRELLQSPVHLIEIDLLRGGKHTTAVPLTKLREKASPFDYHVCCHRFDRLDEYFVYPFRLQDPLPTLPIPLLGEDEVEVDLQAVFTETFDKAGFRRWLSYDLKELEPPLTKAQTVWARARLARK